MATSELKLEVEIRIYNVHINEDKKWWQFWKPKEIRKLSSYEEIEKQTEETECQTSQTT